jgi:YggT family protein
MAYFAPLIQAVVSLILSIMYLFELGLIIYIIVNVLISFEVLNKYNLVVRKVYYVGAQIFEPILARVRYYIPPVAGIDFSPIVVFLLLQFMQKILFNYFLNRGGIVAAL